jgi:hypothetical protein
VDSITLAKAVENVALANSNQKLLDAMSLKTFDLWFEVGRAVYEGNFTVKALETATAKSCKVQVSKASRVLKAMKNSKVFACQISANKYGSLELAYVASAQYANKAKTSRKKMSKLDKAKTWAMTKTIAELTVLEQAIKAAKLAKTK